MNTPSLSNQPCRVCCGAGGLPVHGVGHLSIRRCFAVDMKSTLLFRQLSAPPASPPPSGHPIDTGPKSEHPGDAATDHLERQAYSAVVDCGKNGRAKTVRLWRCLCLGKGSKSDFQNAAARASPGMIKSASPTFCSSPSVLYLLRFLVTVTLVNPQISAR